MAFDAFLKIEGIEGESAERRIRARSRSRRSAGARATPTSVGSGGGGGAGKVRDAGLPLRDDDDQGVAGADDELRERRAHRGGDAPPAGRPADVSRTS